MKVKQFVLALLLLMGSLFFTQTINVQAQESVQITLPLVQKLSDKTISYHLIPLTKNTPQPLEIPDGTFSLTNEETIQLTFQFFSPGKFRYQVEPTSKEALDQNFDRNKGYELIFDVVADEKDRLQLVNSAVNQEGYKVNDILFQGKDSGDPKEEVVDEEKNIDPYSEEKATHPRLPGTMGTIKNIVRHWLPQTGEVKGHAMLGFILLFLGILIYLTRKRKEEKKNV